MVKNVLVGVGGTADRETLPFFPAQTLNRIP